MTHPVRVRFAPSPTGDPHVGNIRTAVFTWLFARHHGGAFVVRVEDTDRARSVQGAVEAILQSLRWLGLNWDEGPDIGGPFAPYVQSQRLDLYRQAAHDLIGSGDAYKCYCSPQRLADLRQRQTRQNRDTGYDRRCRDLDAPPMPEDASQTPVVRFRMPQDGSTAVDDLIRGRVTFENRLAEDFVLLKSDGYPTYHLANVVDDHSMRISHVLRAEEWLPSTPRHTHIYKALGWTPPKFAHLPIILAQDRSKLSKRHGAASFLEYPRQGYLPDAMLNFLTLLGWSLDDKTEILSRKELVHHFTIDRVNRSASIFNRDKLLWTNGSYLRSMTPEALADALLEYWRAYPTPQIPNTPRRGLLARIAPLIAERIKTLDQAAPLIHFFFRDEIDYETEDLIQKGMDRAVTCTALERTLELMTAAQPFDADTLEAALRPLAKELGLKPGQLFGSIRVAASGLRVAPPLFESLEILGRERALSSIGKAVERLRSPAVDSPPGR